MNKEIKNMRAELLRFVTMQCKVYGLSAMELELLCDDNTIAYALWGKDILITIALEGTRLWADGKPMSMEGEVVGQQELFERAAKAINRAIVRKYGAGDRCDSRMVGVLQSEV